MSQSELLCHLHQRLAELELDEVRREGRALKARISDEAKRVDASLVQVAGSPPVPDAGELVAHAVQDHRRATEYFPNQLRLALFSLAYGTFENRIVAIATACLSLGRSKLVPSDFAGDSPLTRARRCIAKTSGLDIPADSWTALEPYRALRNIAVMNGGRFPKAPPKALRQFIADREDTLEATEERGIVIGDDFIEAYVADLARFYEELFDAWAQTH